MEKVIKFYDKDGVKLLGVVPLDEIGGGSLPDNITADEDGLYIQRSDGNVYPISHPDISTQPSILPQRFGNKPIIEKIIPYDGSAHDISFDVIPYNAFIIQARAFGEGVSVNASFQHNMDINGWTSVDAIGRATWLLVQYVDMSDDEYYS